MGEIKEHSHVQTSVLLEVRTVPLGQRVKNMVMENVTGSE